MCSRIPGASSCALHRSTPSVVAVSRLAAAYVLALPVTPVRRAWGTLLQRRVPPALLGRVPSLDSFVSLSLMPLSMAPAGPVSGLMDRPRPSLLAGLAPPVLAVVAVLAARLPHETRLRPRVGSRPHTRQALPAERLDRSREPVVGQHDRDHPAERHGAGSWSVTY